jgi:hypothetical protein
MIRKHYFTRIVQFLYEPPELGTPLTPFLNEPLELRILLTLCRAEVLEKKIQTLQFIRNSLELLFDTVDQNILREDLFDETLD